MNGHEWIKLTGRRVFIHGYLGILGLAVLGLASLCGLGPGEALAEEKNPPTTSLPELRMSLHEAMEAAVNENPTVQLFKERIIQAQDQANTQLGTLLPNISATMSGARRRFFLGR